MSRPAWIAANVVAGLQDIVATLEAMFNADHVDATRAGAFKTSIAVAPAISASTPAPTAAVTGLYQAMVALYNAIPFLVSDVTGIDPSVGTGLIAIAEGLAAAMVARTAIAAFGGAADLAADALPAPAGATTNARTDAANGEIVARFARMVYLAGYVEAIVVATFDTRSEAITARADCVQRFERELELCGWARDIGVATALYAMRDRCVAWLNAAIINSKPVQIVSTPIMMPVLFMAWRLYQDPTRASELLARNDVPTSEFLPTTFEAQAA